MTLKASKDSTLKGGIPRSLDERTYVCDCGYSFDRDIHAAKNVKLFGSTKRAECLEQASVETLTSAALEV